MSRSLMEMTVKEFRLSFYEEYQKIKDEIDEKDGFIEKTTWGKAHKKIMPKKVNGEFAPGVGVCTLFFLLLIGAKVGNETDIDKEYFSYKEDNIEHLYRSSVPLKRLSTVFNLKIGDTSGVKKEVSKIKKNLYEVESKNIGDFFKKYVELMNELKVNDEYMKLLEENPDKPTYLIKLEEERNKMTRTYKTIKDEIKENIEAGVKQIILTGAPGTGKSRMAREIAEELSAELDLDLKNLKEKLDGDKENENVKKELKKKFQEYIEFVQFHPSYDYTDFVEGIRPVEEPEKDGVGFRKVNGIFKQFCQQVVAKNEKEKKYFFIIDEINRADLSKVFGELMYCLESDKRGEHNKITTQYQNMKTYENKTIKDEKGEIINYKIELSVDDKFEAGFYIPENVYIIGTMNDIDRSVESMDFALRRRFMWKEIEVTDDFLKDTLGKMVTDYNQKQNKDSGNIEEKKLIDRINKLNEIIKKKDYGLNKHYLVSQGQFANLPQNIPFDSKNTIVDFTDKICQYVWDNRLKSLLFEYVRGEDNAEDFVAACANKFGVK